MNPAYQSSKPFLPSTLAELALRDWAFPEHVQAMQRNAMDLIHSPTYNRSIIKIPVRHGKSYFHSFLLPCWYMCRYPNRKVGVVSYSDDFAMEWSGNVRNLIQEWGPQTTGVKVWSKYQSRHHFRMAPPHEGEMRGVGIWGALAGKGFHLLVLDDPSKELAELATQVGRDKLFNQFQSEFLNRVEPGGKIIIVQSSRHPDDLSERLLKMNPDLPPEKQWRELKFPALSEEGEALWPERYPRENLEATRDELIKAGNAHIWHSLYEQEPEAAAEACEWPNSYWDDLFYDNAANIKPRHRLVAIDAAAGKHRKTGDFSCILFANVMPDGVFLVEAQMVREPITEFCDRAAKTVTQRGPAGYAMEVSGGQEVLGIYLPTLIDGYPFLTENPEVEIRMGLTDLLFNRKLRIKNTPHGKILANQLRDFPLGPHRSGPNALNLLLKLRDALEAPAEQDDTYTPVTT